LAARISPTPIWWSALPTVGPWTTFPTCQAGIHSGQRGMSIILRTKQH